MSPVSAQSAVGDGEGGFSLETVEIGEPRLDELEIAFDDMRTGSNAKGVIVFDEE